MFRAGKIMAIFLPIAAINLYWCLIFAKIINEKISENQSLLEEKEEKKSQVSNNTIENQDPNMIIRF